MRRVAFFIIPMRPPSSPDPDSDSFGHKLDGYINAELNRTIELVRHYHQQKLEYKKLFIATVSVALIATLIVQLLPPPLDHTSGALLSGLLPAGRVIAVVALLQGLAGFFVAKTLASLRKSETLQHNAHTRLQTQIRSLIDLGLPPLPHRIRALNRGGADYLSIIAVSGCSFLFFTFGGTLFVDSFHCGPIINRLAVILLIGGYLAAHYWVIEATLNDEEEPQPEPTGGSRT